MEFFVEDATEKENEEIFVLSFWGNQGMLAFTGENHTGVSSVTFTVAILTSMCQFH